tara:strand:+ start:783 stop:1160 length:378 start_codon:yes stop_codon:yes gene_type:complete
MLTVDTRQVKNHTSVCYKKRLKDGGYPYSDSTYYLIMGSMAIGIGEITEKNYGEVFTRHMFLHQIINTPRKITLEQVYNNIGLKTNVAFETKARWITRIAKGEYKSLENRTEEKINNINKLGGTI